MGRRVTDGDNKDYLFNIKFGPDGFRLTIGFIVQPDEILQRQTRVSARDGDFCAEGTFDECAVATKKYVELTCGYVPPAMRRSITRQRYKIKRGKRSSCSLRVYKDMLLRSLVETYIYTRKLDTT